MTALTALQNTIQEKKKIPIFLRYKLSETENSVPIPVLKYLGESLILLPSFYLQITTLLRTLPFSRQNNPYLSKFFEVHISKTLRGEALKPLKIRYTKLTALIILRAKCPPQ